MTRLLCHVAQQDYRACVFIYTDPMKQRDIDSSNILSVNLVLYRVHIDFTRNYPYALSILRRTFPNTPLTLAGRSWAAVMMIAAPRANTMCSRHWFCYKDVSSGQATLGGRVCRNAGLVYSPPSSISLVTIPPRLWVERKTESPSVSGPSQRVHSSHRAGTHSRCKIRCPTSGV